MTRAEASAGRRLLFHGWRVLLVGAVMMLVLPASVAAQTPTSARDDALQLAERYSPIVMVSPQDGPCDSGGEAFAPMSVDLVLDNPDVLLRQAGVGDPVVERGPSAASLFGRGEGFFLDFPGLALEPGCVYERDYRADSSRQAPVVYAHIATQPDAPGRLAVQYWLYWYYNDWNNKHESDWEFIQVLFDASEIAEALSEDPVSVGYAQHEGGERSAWSDGKLGRDETHPRVFSSRGSHASYFERAVLLGRNGSQGFGCDTTADNTTELRPNVELLPDSVILATDDYAWLGFTGRWGERASGPFNGPTGPNTKSRWERPIDWHDDLRPASVVIPGGDQTNATMLSTFCSVVDFGSNQLRAFQVSPTRLLVVAIAGFALLRMLTRRTDWSSTAPTPLRRRRRVGQMLRASMSSYVSSRGALLAVGACYLPLALVVALVGWLWSFTAAQGVAAVFTTVMVVIVTAIVSAYWHLESGDDSRALTNSFLLVRRRSWRIAKTSLLASGIVAVLSVSIIGIPFAIRQAVRYQFAVPVATTEDTSGMDALRRSSELVSGRWWHTAVPVVLLVSVGFLINSALQLGLLIGLSGFPLWVYVALAFLVTGLVLPMIATGPILLYGDAVAGSSPDQNETELTGVPDVVGC